MCMCFSCRLPYSRLPNLNVVVVLLCVQTHKFKCLPPVAHF